MSTGGTADRLDALARRIRDAGQPELADEAAAIGAALRGGGVPEPAGGVMTTGQAAAALGIASVNTIKHWVRAGLLEGYQRGGRIMVSRASVDRMLSAPTLADERAYERDLDEALAPFDAGERPLPQTAWTGRKPWAKGADVGS